MKLHHTSGQRRGQERQTMNAQVQHNTKKTIRKGVAGAKLHLTLLVCVVCVTVDRRMYVYITFCCDIFSRIVDAFVMQLDNKNDNNQHQM